LQLKKLLKLKTVSKIQKHFNLQKQSQIKKFHQRTTPIQRILKMRKKKRRQKLVGE